MWFLLAEVTFHIHVPQHFAKPNITCKNYDTGALYAHSTSDWSLQTGTCENKYN